MHRAGESCWAVVRNPRAFLTTWDLSLGEARSFSPAPYARRPSARTLGGMPAPTTRRTLLLFVAAACSALTAPRAQAIEPDPLRASSGAAIEDAEQWQATRRPEVLELFRRHVYGRAPAPRSLAIEQQESADALDGAAVRKQWSLRYGEGDDEQIHVLAYLPRERARPTPVFVALNFHGNQTVHPDPGIRMATCWVRNNPGLGVTENRATEETRGSASRRWPLKLLLSRGYGLVTACYGDIDPDFDDGFKNGVHGVIEQQEGERPDDAWGSRRRLAAARPAGGRRKRSSAAATGW